MRSHGGGSSQERLAAALADLPVVWVGVRCDPELAAVRERHRSDRVGGMARLQAVRVHQDVVYDLVVDQHCRQRGRLCKSYRFSTGSPRRLTGSPVESAASAKRAWVGRRIGRNVLPCLERSVPAATSAQVANDRLGVSSALAVRAAAPRTAGSNRSMLRCPGTRPWPG